MERGTDGAEIDALSRGSNTRNSPQNAEFFVRRCLAARGQRNKTAKTVRRAAAAAKVRRKSSDDNSGSCRSDRYHASLTDKVLSI